MIDQSGNITPEGALLLGAAAYDAMQPKEPPDLKAFFLEYPEAISQIESRLGYATEVVRAAVGLHRNVDPTLTKAVMATTQVQAAPAMPAIPGILGMDAMGGIGDQMGTGTNQGPDNQPDGLRTAVQGVVP